MKRTFETVLEKQNLTKASRGRDFFLKKSVKPGEGRRIIVR